MKSPASFLNYLFETWPEFVAHFSFNDVKDYFEADMDMRICNAAGRDRGDVR